MHSGKDGAIVSKQDKPGSGEQAENQNAAPPTFGAGSSGTGSSGGSAPPASIPPASIPPAGFESVNIPQWVPPAVAPAVTGPGAQGFGRGSDGQAEVDWFASQQSAGYFPAAGPLASGAEKGDSGLSWGFGGRNRLQNILLFGVAPVVLVGIIAAAYMFSTSGKGHTVADAGFHAAAAGSAGAPQVQDASTPSPGPGSPSAKAKPSPKISFPSLPTSKAPAPGTLPGGSTGTHSGGAPKPNPAPRHSKSPKPAHSRAPAAPVPSDLGAPNFNGYCSSTKEGTAIAVVNDAYGWRCSSDASTPLSSQAVCAYTYRMNSAQIIDVTTNFYSSSEGIQCWSTHGQLGGVDFTTYCSSTGLGKATLAGPDAIDWQCSSDPDLNETVVCRYLYNNSQAFARYELFTDPDSWQCWA